ncbi:sulfite exporter TauE/SafE family protein [Variovorax sp. V15]|uniref:sulfite exporter TauE/SafE family protein n=1 Tax=unclassified Variovorax TaxID=663243 RepID=UPI0034E84C5C
MELYFWLAACGTLAGVTTVLFGFGGGFVVVPLLYHLLTHMRGPETPAAPHAMQIAVATSTCVMIFGSAMATAKHQRAGSLDWAVIKPLVFAIAAGSVLGAATAAAVEGGWLRWAFIAYVSLTVLDCWLRPGFLLQPAREARPARARNALTGIVIGWIAALLGVGGSVMTVPLLRRRGVSMTGATAMANPLTLPVALAGTATYAALSWGGMASLGAGYVGYVDLRAFLALVAGSYAGIRMASPFIGRIPDQVHARVYVGLLVAVVASMLIG